MYIMTDMSTEISIIVLWDLYTFDRIAMSIMSKVRKNCVSGVASFITIVKQLQ